MPPADLRSDEPLHLPPSPGLDRSQMLRRHIVATALGQLRAAARERAGLHTPAAWQAYSARIRRAFRAAIDHPALRLRPTWRERPRGGRSLDGFHVESVLVESLRDAWMNVTVWKPDPRRFPPPWPAIVMPVGHNGKYFPSEQHPPQVFAANGFLSVSFDPPGFGEKAEGNNHFEDGVRGYVVVQNPLAFFLADAKRAVDYVWRRPDVDPRGGVTMTGVSGGGFTSICGALIDPRVTVIAPSCFGLADELHPVRNGYAGCPETLWLGRFAAGLGLENLLIGARFRPLLLMAGRRDVVMSADQLDHLVSPVRAAYRGAGCPERLRVLADDCGHEYSVAQAVAVVNWIRRCRPGSAPARSVAVPRRLRLLDPRDLHGNPPRGTTMASAAAEAAGVYRAPISATMARRGLADLIPGLVESRRRGLRRRTARQSAMTLWTHRFEEFVFTDGPRWELPALALEPPAPRGGVFVYFDDRGRWTDLHRWGWLNRVAGVFAPGARAHAVLSVDLAGWGDSRPVPSAYDVVSWGGVDRWTGYVSAATGESVMAMRLRDAVRVIDWVRSIWRVPASRIVVGGHGLGATVAGLAACLHGGVGGALLVEPLARFADLATAAKSVWPHDAYFPGILRAVDLPDAVARFAGRTLVVGPRGASGELLGAAARRSFSGKRVRVLPAPMTSSVEAKILQWLHYP